MGRQGDLLDLGAGGRELARRRLERLGAGGLRLAPLRRAAQPDPRRRRPDGDLSGHAVQRVPHQDRIVDRARDGAKGVEGRRESLDAGCGIHAECRLDADDAAERRGPDDRRSGLRAERCRHHVIRDRGRRAAGRSAGRVPRVVRIGGFARREIGELGRDGLAEGYAAGAPDHRHAGGIGTRPVALVDGRAVGGRHVGGVDDVLDADGHAVQRAARRFAVARPRLGHRPVAIEIGPGADLALARGDAVEARPHQVLRGDLARGDGGGRVAGAQFIQFRCGHALLPRAMKSGFRNSRLP